MENKPERKETPQERWQKKNLRRFSVMLNRTTDAHIISALEKQQNISGYIREALHEYIRKDQ